MLSASAMVASRLSPFNRPSRAMSVKMMAATPGILESPCDVECAHLRGCGPTFDRDLAVSRIQSNGDAPGKPLARQLLTEIRIAHGSGADDDASDALGEPGFDRFQVADAAAKLHRYGDRRQHRLDRSRVHRPAGKGAIEIDHVQIFEPLRGKARRLCRGIDIEHGRARHVALFEPHALAVLEVDGRKKNHGFHFRKFAIRARPKRWLFSG